MGQQKITGAFRTNNLGPGFGLVNLEDQPGSGGGTVSQWTQGATLIDAINIQPSLGESWHVNAFEVRFRGGLAYSGPPAFGRLGKLIAGLSQQKTTLSAGFPWVNPVLALPNDPFTAITVLWDGSTDPPFPALQFGNPPVTEAIIGGLDLNQPLEISSGETITIGLWLTPSLVQGVTPNIFDATYTVIYDDGKPPVAGWGGP